MNYVSEDHKEIQSGEKKDEEGYMANIEIDKIMQSLSKLKKTITSSDQQLPAWVQSKITKASDYIDIAADYLSSDVKINEKVDTPEFRKRLDDTREMVQDTLRARKERLKKEAEAKQQRLDLPNFLKKEEISLVDKILVEMIGDKPGWNIKKSNSLEDIAKKHKISIDILKKQLKKGIKIEMEHTTDQGEAKIIALQHLDEIPDYYSRLTKMEKGAQEVKESKKYMSKDEDPCWTGYKMQGTKNKKGKQVPNCVKVDEAISRIPMQNGQMLNVLVNWRGRHISAKMFFPQTKIPNRNEITYAVNKIYPEARVISYLPCEFSPDQPFIQTQNSKSKNYLLNNGNIGEEFKVNEDWQSVNKKDKTDGMSQKAVDTYRRENPGSNLQTAVTEKNPTGKRAGRQSKYCSRSKGQQEMHNIDCSETPDKPICKARKRWNCKN